MEWPKITLFGDSITRRANDPDLGCWASCITNQVGYFFDVDTRGFDGYNSQWALELMPQLFPKSYLDKVELFIPFFGHNDSWKPPTPLHLPVDQFEVNMQGIIKYLLDNGVDKKKIIMITPTWYHDEAFQKFNLAINMPPTGKDFENAKSYRDAIARIAAKEGIECLDFFEVSLKHQPLGELFSDGIHYSRKGADLFFEHLMPIITKKIEASYKKPLPDLWHVTPFDQRSGVKEEIEAYRNRNKKQ